MDELYRHEYWNGRVQYDEYCQQVDCDGIARVEMAYAPDRGRNWLKCDKCGHRYV